MRTLVNLILVIGLFSTALVTYFMKYKSRQLDLEIRKTGRMIEEREKQLSILRGELSVLSRPARVERLSDKLLGMRQTDDEQYISKFK